MIKTKVYKCNECGAILILPSGAWYRDMIRCTVCNGSLKRLEDDFDLSEIVVCDSCNNKTGEVEEP